MKYQALACPLCGVEASPPVTDSCNNCGFILDGDTGLVEKIFYSEDEYCKVCGNPGGLVVIRIDLLKEVHINTYLLKPEKYIEVRCNHCHNTYQRPA